MSVTQEEMKKITTFLLLAENYNHKPTDALLNIWLELSKEYNANEMLIACKEVIKNYKFKTMPPFAVIYDELKKLRNIDQDSLEIEANIKFDTLLNTIQKYGAYNEPPLSDKAKYVIKCLGGWGNICKWQEKHIDFKRKEFIDLWVQAKNKKEFIAQLSHSDLLKEIETRKQKAIEM